MTPLLSSAQGTFFDLSLRAKLRVAGPDRLRFLNGQISNDVRKATAASAIQGCVLTARGKMSANVFLSAEADCFMLDAEPELRETLAARLERYIIADDVQLEDVSDHFALFHVSARTTPVLFPSAKTIRADRFACTGWDVWLERAEHDRLRQHLSVSLTFCDAECAENLRIERGIPRWGRELTEEIIPIEANLEATSVDYGKGCYIGQEVISRIKMSGQINKRLCGLISHSGAPLQAGLRLAPREGEQKDVGWITSATRSERLQKEIALGYVKRGFNSSGARLQTLGGMEVPVEIVGLPFV